MNPSFLKGLPIDAEPRESSTEAAPEVRTFEFSPRIKVGEANIFALLLVILASNQFKNCPPPKPPVTTFGTFDFVIVGFAKLAVVRPSPELFIISVSPVLNSKTRSDYF